MSHETEKPTIALVGHCTPDAFALRSAISGFYPDAQIETTVVRDLPGGSAALERSRPIYEEHLGWDSPTASVTRFEDLPEGAVSYVRRVEELVGCRIDIISTGPRRHETITVNPVI